MGSVIKEKAVETQIRREAKPSSCSYFWASMAIVLGAGMAVSKMHTLIAKEETGKRLQIKKTAKGMSTSRIKE
jgi:hypothetical protein